MSEYNKFLKQFNKPGAEADESLSEREDIIPVRGAAAEKEEPVIEEIIEESQPETLNDAPAADEEEVITETIVYVNPLYE